MSIAADKALSETRLDVDGRAFYVARLPEDPICLRASIGGKEQPALEQVGGYGTYGYYLTYRGDPMAVKEMLRRALVALEKTLC